MFDLILPFPFRILFLVISATWLWTANLRAFHAVHINYPRLLKLPAFSYTDALDVALSASYIGIGSFLVYHVTFGYFLQSVAQSDKPQVAGLVFGDVLVLSAFAGVVYVVFVPRKVPSVTSGKSLLRQTLRRVLVADITAETRLTDILLADSLTSYAKVIADFSIFLCHVVNLSSCFPAFDPNNNQFVSPLNRDCGISAWLVPILSAYPSAIRFGQCLKEYRQSGGRNRWHFLNAVKYASAFPVIFFNALLASLGPEDDRQRPVMILWVFSGLVNSSYSFLWDLSCDWELTLIRGLFVSLNPLSLPEKGLRQVLHFDPRLYFAAIVENFILRFIWLVRFLPTEGHSNRIYLFFATATSTSGGLFVLQLLEIMRRWIWIFFRVEAEWIRVSGVPESETFDLEDLGVKSMA